MKYLVTISDSPYFHWQLLVQYNNFKEIGIEDDLIWAVSFDYGKGMSNEMKELIINTGVKTIGIADKRELRSYSCSVRHYILSKIFRGKPYLKDETIFLVDPDVLFTKKMSTSRLLDNDTWYMSDTKSYLDSKYIRSKSEELFNEMCGIVGIDPEVVIANDDNAGGAQIIMKNLTQEFWDKTYNDSEKLYQYMTATSSKYDPEHPIQAWTADMWAILWNAWLFGHETKIIKRMDFAWATDPIKRISERSIYHNAGVIKQDDLLNKGKFSNNHPFNEDFSYVNKEMGSYYYVENILKTKENYSHIIEKLK